MTDTPTILVVIELPEGYEDCHPEIVIEDCIRDGWVASDVTSIIAALEDQVRDFEDALQSEMAKSEKYDAEIERLKVWGSDSHVTELEERVAEQAAQIARLKELGERCGLVNNWWMENDDRHPTGEER